MKNFHKTNSPGYVLYSRLQAAGGAGPQKWEHRSRMGVYLGHSPFYAGSVALVLNPLTRLVSPQYHVVFDDESSTLAYMEAGSVPPNWLVLIKYSYERATDEDFSLAETRSTSTSDAIADPVNDPFVIVLPDEYNATPLYNAQVSPGNFPDTNGISVYEGDHLSTSGTKHKSSAVRSHEKVTELSTGGRFGSYQDESSSILTTQKMPVTTSFGELRIPPRLNLCEIGLYQSECIHELNQQVKYSKGKRHMLLIVRLQLERCLA